MATQVPSYDFTWEQGEDGVIMLTYKDASGTPVDLSLQGDNSRYAVRMDVRKADNTLLFTFNSEDISEVPSVDSVGPSDNEAVLGADGKIAIVIPRRTSLSGGAFASSLGSDLNYDIFLRHYNADGTNVQKKILRGKISFEESFTLWS